MGAFSWYLYPQVRVRVHAGMGTGGPKFTHGLPVTNPNGQDGLPSGPSGKFVINVDLFFQAGNLSQ